MYGTSILGRIPFQSGRLRKQWSADQTAWPPPWSGAFGPPGGADACSGQLQQAGENSWRATDFSNDGKQQQQ